MFTKLLAEHDHDEGEGDESQEVGFEFFIAGSDSAELLEFVKKALDFVALFVAFLIVDDEIQAVRLRRDDRGNAYKCRFFHVSPSSTGNDKLSGDMGMAGQGSGQPWPRGNG